MNRPKGLALTVVLMAVCNAMLWATIKPGRMLGLFTVFICVGYVVIWFYWKGRNWARIGVLLFSGFSIVYLLNWNRISLAPSILAAPAHVMMASRAVLGGALLYYLNTRPVLDFFYPENKPAPLRYGWGRILYGLWIILNSVQTHLPTFAPLRPSNKLPATPPTIGTLLTVLVGVSIVAWGARAGIVPYHANKERLVAHDG